MGVIRVLPEAQIEELLRTALVGRIACCAPGIEIEGEAASARPFLVPLAYGYDGASVYAHSGPGRKITIMRAQPLVSFEVDRADAADRWASVIAEGIYEEIADATERAAALRVIYPGPDGPPQLGDLTIVYRIRLTAKSGRFETPDDRLTGDGRRETVG